MGVAPHPRLLVGEDELPALRARLKREPIHTMLQKLLAAAETNDRAVAGTRATEPYDEATAAHRCAFLWLLTGEPRWAERARHYVERRLDDPLWAERSQKGLSLYYISKSVALAYDACFHAPSWDTAFRARVAKALRTVAEVIFTDGGKEQNTNPASNWQALRFSSAGLCYLALDATDTDPRVETALTACYEKVKAYLRANLGESPQSRGWNSEGLGYTYYPMGNGVCPFAIAYRRRWPERDLRDDVPALRTSLWTCYAALVKTPQGLLRPDFGDDNPGTSAEGTLGFAFHFCPPELLPGLRFWYDRTVGSLGNRSFDADRFGTMASILYYPLDTPAKDPLTLPAWRALLPDPSGNGFFTWRDRYRDEGDLVVQLYTKNRGNRGHSGPDALSFRIVGRGGLWATGGGRYGLKLGGLDAYVRSMNTLYPSDPDGPLTISKESGKPLFSDERSLTAQSGLNNLGVRNHTRRFAVDFAPEGATIVLADTSENGRFWQLCALENLTLALTGERTFLLTAPTGETLQGTVLATAGAPRLQMGLRKRGSPVGALENNRFVTCQSDDGCYVVVLTVVGRGKRHPHCTFVGESGSQPSGMIMVGARRFSLTAERLTRL